MNELIFIDREKEVKKAKALVQSRYKLNPLALKLITTLIASVQDTDTPNQIYSVRAKDFIELSNIKGGNRENLQEACAEIMSKPLKIEDDKKWIIANWCSSIEYVKGEGIINFEISSKLLPYIKNLKNNYLKYNLINILPLRSDYSIRIYEWLKDEFNKYARYGKKTELILEVQEIRDRLEIPESYRWDNIRQRILDKAKDDLKENCDIKFDWEVASKIGKAISHIKFKIYSNSKNSIHEVNLPPFLDSFLSYVNYLKPLYQDKNAYFIILNTDIGEGNQIYYFGIDNDGFVYAMSEKGGYGKKIGKDKAEIVLNASYICSLHSEIYRDFIQNKANFWKLKNKNEEYFGILLQEINAILQEHDPREKPLF